MKLKQIDAENALKTLRDILAEPYSIIVRDASIQRFEYTFEAIWTFIKLHLEVNDGILALSPKQCFRELLRIGTISEADCIFLLDATDKRNETSHTYKAIVADAIFSELPAICTHFEILMAKFKA